MISVIIPVLNEAATVASVVAFARQDPNVTEVLVVDDGSTDGTPERARAAGATVLTSTLLGKGASMEDGMRAARNEFLLYLDGDLSSLRADLVARMTRPLVLDEADFVKARFSRAAGRVTALTARPLLHVFFPELAHFEQPLSGVIAARRSLLRRLRFENDYGVDVGLFLDAAAAGGRITEVDIGHLEHHSKPLTALADMASQVTRTLLDRAARCGRLRLSQILEVQEGERRRQAELPAVLNRLGAVERLALFDMDGTLLDGRFILELARRTGRMSGLAGLLDNPEMPADERTRQIAALFAGVAREVFERAAREIPLMPGAVETIVALRKAGYRVGLVTDSYRIAAEVVRRRVFADFSIAHLMRFRGEMASGQVTLSTVMTHGQGCRRHLHCKSNVLLHFQDRIGLGSDRVLAVGDGENDICLLRAAGTSVAFRPATSRVRAAARQTVTGSLLEVLRVAGVGKLASEWQPTSPYGAGVIDLPLELGT